jgi:Tfp pilus assembly protein PilF
MGEAEPMTLRPRHAHPTQPNKIGRPRRRGAWRAAAAIAAAVSLASASSAILTGCAASRGSPAAEQPDDARLREARELQVRADDARKRGKDDEAVDLYRRSLGLDGANAACWNNLGTMLMEKQDYMGAASALRAAADLAPTDPRPLENLGHNYSRAGFDEDALRYYLESLERDANWINSIRGVSNSAYRLSRADDRILEVLSRGQMIETDPKWRERLTREKIRVQAQIKFERDAARREGR